MKTIIILFLMVSTAYGQVNKVTGLPTLKFSSNDKKVAALQFMAGFADGWHEAIKSYHWGTGRFWDARTSWKNKYYDYDKGATREAYFFSKNLLVWTTDGYHLTRMINRSAMVASLVIIKNEKRNWKYLLRKAIILSIINRAGFMLAYNGIFK